MTQIKTWKWTPKVPHLPLHDDEDEVSVRESEERRQAEYKKEAEEFPKWARRLQPGTKRLPNLGLTNVDADYRDAHVSLTTPS
jgi:hypothetical protein